MKKMDCVDRINDKKGGGIALICKDNIRSKLIEKPMILQFIDEFLDLYMWLSEKHLSMIITGDFQHTLF